MWPTRRFRFIYPPCTVCAVSHAAPAGRPKAAQSAARVPPERQPDPLCGALLQWYSIEHIKSFCSPINQSPAAENSKKKKIFFKDYQSLSFSPFFHRQQPGAKKKRFLITFIRKLCPIQEIFSFFSC